MPDVLLSYPVVTFIFIALTMINLFLNTDEKKYDWKRISTRKLAIYTTCLLYVMFAIIFVFIPDYTTDFLKSISASTISISNLDNLTSYSPAYLVSIGALYPLFSYDHALLARFMNLGIFAILQLLIYKASFAIKEKNHERIDFKTGFALFFSSPFVILNVLIIEGIDLYITALMILGIYLMLRNHAFLAGLIFGYLALVQFNYFLYFIGMIWYLFKRNGKRMMMQFLFSGILAIAMVLVVFLWIDYLYVLYSLFYRNHDYVLSDQYSIFNYDFNSSFIYNLNVLGVLLQLFYFLRFYLPYNLEYIVPNNLISIVIFLFLMRYLRTNFSSKKSLIDIFIASSLLTLNLSYFSFIGILSLTCFATPNAKKKIRRLYINLNILFFLQILLLYFESPLDNNNSSPLFLGDVILISFVIVKLLAIDANLIWVMNPAQNVIEFKKPRLKIESIIP